MVQQTEERRLVRVDFQDGPPRIVRAFVMAIVEDLLDVSIGNPMELQEELPSLHIVLN